jgi:hypothetical protein
MRASADTLSPAPIAQPRGQHVSGRTEPGAIVSALPLLHALSAWGQRHSGQPLERDQEAWLPVAPGPPAPSFKIVGIVSVPQGSSPTNHYVPLAKIFASFYIRLLEWR